MNTPIRNAPHLVAALLVLQAASCKVPNDWEGAWGVLGPVPASGHLAYVVQNTRQVVILDPAGNTAPIVHDVDPRPRALVPLPDGVLVVGGKGVEPVLERIPVPTGDATRVALPGAYDRFGVRDDGRYVVLYYDPSRPPVPGAPAVRNNNEIAIVDLANGTVKAVALQTESLAPREVVFSPDNEVVAVVFDGAIVFVTLADPDDRVVVPLKVPGGTQLTPRKILFSQDGAYLFIQATGSDDVLSLEVTKSAEGLSSSVNFLFFPGASGLVDLLVPKGAAFEDRVVALYATASSARMVLLEATGDASQTRQAAFTSRLTTLIDLGDGLILGYAKDATSGGVSPVAGWDPVLGRFDEDKLSGALEGAVLATGGVTFFPHRTVVSGGGPSSALTAVRLQRDETRLRVRLTPMALAGKATALTLHDATGTLYAAVEVAREESGAAPLPGTEDDFSGTTAAIVSVRADDTGLAGLALDRGVVSLGITGEFLWSAHPSSIGDVTFLPLTGTARSEARRYVGFLGSNLFDAVEGQ